MSRSSNVTQAPLGAYTDHGGKICLPDGPELKGPIFGHRLLAMIGWIKAVRHRQYSTNEMWVEDIPGVPLSRGYLAELGTGTISASPAAALPRKERLDTD